MKQLKRKLAACALAFSIAAYGASVGMVAQAAEETFTAPTAPSTDVSDAKNPRYYANGTDLVIDKDADGNTVVKAVGAEEGQIIDGTWYVYAGSKDAGSNYDEVTITMNDGAVRYIIGSNQAAGSIKTSNIVVKNGAVGIVIANQGANGGGAASYEARDTFKVGTSNITIEGGTFQAVAGTYGYTLTETVNMTIKGGTFTATTSPTQTGIILGGTNGEVKNATLNMTGGNTKGIALAQRTMITGKAVLNITGGTVGSIYMGSRYNKEEDSSNTGWWFSNYGYVNYGQAAAIDLTIGADVKYNDVYAGFQFYAEEVAKFKETYANKVASNAALALDYSKAPVSIVLNAKPDADYTPADIDKDNISLLRTLGMSNVTVKDNTIVPDVPTVDPEKPVEDVTVGVTDEASQEAIADDVKDIVSNVLQNGKDAELENVVSNDDTPVAEKIADALANNQEIKVEVLVNPVKEDAVQKADKDLITGAVKDDTIAQYLDLQVVLKADDEVIGTLTQLSKPVTYTILLPEELANQENLEFYVIRVHDGKTDKLPLTKVSGNQYSFTTDRYSTYALAYSKVAAPTIPEKPATGDSANLLVPVACLVLAAAGIAVLLTISKKREAARHAK